MEKQKPHILVIDDDHIFCLVLSETLTTAGYQVTTVHSGYKGLSILRKNPHAADLIVLDRIMPQLTGLDVLHKLCLMPIVRDIPVIMLTSHAEMVHVKTAVTYGVFDTLYKPVEEELLLQVIARALKNRADKNW